MQDEASVPAKPGNASIHLEEKLHRDNLDLNRAEYALQHIYLRSQPTYLTIVLGNACNIYCPHCYQTKNGDNLLRPPQIGRELRREFMGLYPYLSTLRLQGGEVFALKGFRELLEDISLTVSRPMVSISTNGTLINEEWAERIVRTPFQTVTASIDGATPETFRRLRRGAELESVLRNMGRIQNWKKRLGTSLPRLDSFFVIMRSNFREIPDYLQLMKSNEIKDVVLQTLLTDERNLSREPTLADEILSGRDEVRELHSLLQEALGRERRHFASLRLSGLRSLFEENGLDASFLQEEVFGLYPDDRKGGDSNTSARVGQASQGSPSQKACAEGREIELCPNPWSTLFVTENGDVSLCFQSAPVGNLYQTPLAGIWNSPQALAKRSRMISGEYLSSGCSKLWCSWREGKSSKQPGKQEIQALRSRLNDLTARALPPQPALQTPQMPSRLKAVRRLLSAKEQRIAEMETTVSEIVEANQQLHATAQKHIDHLESKIVQMEDTSSSQGEYNQQLHEAAQRHIDHLESKIAQMEDAFSRFRRKPLVRAASALSSLLEKIRKLLSSAS